MTDALETVAWFALLAVTAVLAIAYSDQQGEIEHLRDELDEARQNIELNIESE